MNYIYNYHSKNILRAVCSCKFIRIVFEVPHISAVVRRLPFFWLTSLSMVVSRSTAAAADSIISFFSYGWVMPHLNNIPLYMYHIFFIRSLIDGHWGCFHVLQMVKLCRCRGVQVSFDLQLCLGVCQRLGSAVIIQQLHFSFMRNLHIVFHSGYTNLDSHQQHKNILFFTSSPAFVIYRLKL